MSHNNSIAVSGNDITTASSVNVTGQAKKRFWWMRTHRRANKAADNFFYRLGYWVATHTKLTLLICVVLVGACCSGFINFEFENDSEDLWAPSNSLSKKQERVVLSYFNDSSDYAAMLVDSPSDDGVLTKEAMDAIWELHNLVLEIETNGKTYEDLCNKGTDGATCEQNSRSVTRFWDDNFDTYEASVTNDADVIEAINMESYPDGTSVSLEAVFGNTLEYNSTTGDVTSAGAMMQMYVLDANTDDAEDDAYKWMADYQDFMGDLDDEYDSIFGVEYITSRSIEDALAESTSGETFLFVTTYMIMFAVVSVAVGRCRQGSVQSRPDLGSASIYVVVAAGLAAYGVNSGFGVPFTTLSMTLPFILVGIGVDDMFVIVAAFDHTNPDLPVEERVALSLKRCGVSITYTSLTNVLAFMLGSTTCLPAVEYFCLYAGTAILFNFFLQVTAFVAIMTIDDNRQKAGRNSFCCCLKNKAFLEEQERIQRGVVLPPDSESTEQNCTATRGQHAQLHELGRVGRFMKEKYTPAILSMSGKITVLLGTAALLAAGIYGVTQATQGFDVLDLAPDDHYVRDYTELAREYDLEMESQFVALGVYTREVDYTDVDVQVQIQETDALMKEQEFISGPLESWLSSFVEWAASNTEYSSYVSISEGYSVFNDSSTFYAAVTEFVKDEDYERFQDDIVFQSDGSIEISRSWLFLVDIVDTDSNMDAIKQTRDVIDESTLDPDPFGFSYVFVYIEQYFVIYDELILSFVLALVAVAVLSLFILGDVAMVALVCFTVFIIDLDLLGFVYHWGLDVNSITVIELIMAVGLVVDYMVHIVHFFLHQDPNIPKDARIADALGEIGPSVTLGAITTFLGIMPLAFASNVIFRVFFKMFLVIITFGFFHGAVFIPVMLSLLPEWCLMNDGGSENGHQTKESCSTEDHS